MQRSSESRGGASQEQTRSWNKRGPQNQPAEAPSKMHGGIHGYQADKNPFGGLRQLEWRKGLSPFLFVK